MAGKGFEGFNGFKAFKASKAWLKRATQQFQKPIQKQLAGPTSPLELVLAAYRGQGSHATVSKAEIEAVCTAYVAAHACLGGVLRRLQRMATASVEEPRKLQRRF